MKFRDIIQFRELLDPIQMELLGLRNMEHVRAPCMLISKYPLVKQG